MRSISLIFGTHNHQPDGTPSEQFEEAYQNTYKPFLSLLYNYPRIPVVLHYCGSLFEWLEAAHPEFIMLLKEMIKREQVELLGGGYYAPVLCLLPDGDKLGQIEMMNTFIRTTFGTRPRGSWIMERVWEPGLARILSNSGIEYTFLDDHYFRIAGLEAERCYHPYLTEDQGKTVTVVPLQTELQNMIPHSSPEDLIIELNESADFDASKIACIVLPAERLVDSNETEQIYGEEGWLPRFLDLINKNRDWLHAVNPRFARERLAPRGRLYFPCLSSSESMKSALSAKRQKVFQELAKKLRKPESEAYLQGGYFRQFLTKYPEISLLYSRLMYTHLLVSQIRGDKYKKKAALNELWKGETGAVYWNGERGRTYESALRKAAYRAFIEAERVTRRVGMFMPSIIAADFDMDGHSEYLYQGKVLNAFVHRVGASLFELDYIPKRWNYLDTIARWPEPYHKYKYEGCDWYLRKAFLDHFFSPNTTLEKFDRMNYQELGEFLDQPFELEELRREQRRLIMVRNGTVRIGRKKYPLSLRKSYRFKEYGIELSVRLTNQATVPLRLIYGSELNLSFSEFGEQSASFSAVSGEREIHLAPQSAAVEAISRVCIEDKSNSVQITLAADKQFALWSLPVQTVCYIRKKKETTYQSSCFLCRWNLEIEPSRYEELKLSLDLRKR